MPQDERFRTHRAMRQLLEVIAGGRPLVLLLDDLHWADSGSIELLGSLLRRPPAAAVLIVMALRPRQVPSRLLGALARADCAGMLSRVEARHADRRGVPPAARRGRRPLDREQLHAASGGNPFYLQQLARVPLRTGPAPGVLLAGVGVPAAVAEALTEELALLDTGVRRVFEGAAVAGDPFEPELAAAAADVSETAAVEALDELLRRDLVRPTDVPRRFRFRHPLVRRAVYDASPAAGAWSRTSGPPTRSPPAGRRRWRARTTSSTPPATATRPRSRCCATPAWR